MNLLCWSKVELMLEPSWKNATLGTLLLIVCVSAWQAQAAQLVFNVLENVPGNSLLKNGAFEESNANGFAHWSSSPDGMRIESSQGRDHSTALAVECTDTTHSMGASQTVQLDQVEIFPLVIRGWSKALDVSGSPDSGYSLYVDLVYADGTPLWGQTANFPTATHDWVQRQVVIIPQKPVRSLTLHCIFRGHSGTALFDNVTVEELRTGAGSMLFQGAPVRGQGFKDRELSFVQRCHTQDGMRLVLAEEGVSVSIPEFSFASSLGGFLVRDVTTNSGFYSVDGWRCDPLGLQVKADYRPLPDHIEVTGRVIDFLNQDRAVTVVFALPVHAVGWTWGDDARRSRIIDGTSDYVNLTNVPCGATGGMSLYPLAAVSGPEVGLAISIDARNPAVYRVGYHAGAQLLYIAYDFALVPETRNFPRSAEFRFHLFRFKPKWGFRAALQKYMAISWMYRSEIRDQGIWMPFTDIRTVEGWEDFGFRFKEEASNLAWEDRHGILTFRHTEPMTWWMRMEKGLPRTLDAAQRVRRHLAAQGRDSEREMAQVLQIAAMHDENGQPALVFRDTPWCDGAIWSINPNPALRNPGQDTNTTVLNGATVLWNEKIADRHHNPARANGRLDGECLDSLEGDVTADLNYRREHFADSTVPLTFDYLNKRPVLFKGLAIYEYTKWLSRRLIGWRKLLFANGVPHRFGFLCYWLDVLGTETDWVRNGEYHPTEDREMLYWRSLSGQKPYCLLMNTDFNVFTSDMVELYFQRSLFYGMFPSMFSHNASESPYWQNPQWYNRDRELFKRYQPIIKRVAEAGWQPVTYATSSNPTILVERFGPGTNGTNYFTIMNDSSSAQTGALHIDLSALRATSPTPTEILSNQTLDLAAVELPSADIPLNLKPRQVQVYAIPVTPTADALNWRDIRPPYAPAFPRLRK